jgi:single-strand DNA-binding protein
MRSLNKVFLLGRVGNTPEELHTKAGRPYTRLHVATNRSWKDENAEGGRREATDWHYVMVWGTLANICRQGIRKGSLVFIEGYINHYQTETEPGKMEERYSIHAKEVSFTTTMPKGIAKEVGAESIAGDAGAGNAAS